jgi:hypothetical protein
MIVLIPSIELNPESHYYYQVKSVADYKNILPEISLPHAEECLPLPFEEVSKRINGF